MANMEPFKSPQRCRCRVSVSSRIFLVCDWDRMGAFTWPFQNIVRPSLVGLPQSFPTTEGMHHFHRQYQCPQPGPRSVYLLPDAQVDMIFPGSSAYVGDRPTAKRGSNWLLRDRELIPFLWPGSQLISQLLSWKLYASFLFIWRFDLTL